MLREDIKAKPNPCENIIHITYYGKDKRSDSINLLKELKAKFPDMYGDFPDDEIYTDLGFTSEWVSPLQFLQHLCNKYTADIIGVAYEFIDGYVESFELKNELIENICLITIFLCILNKEPHMGIAIIWIFAFFFSKKRENGLLTQVD